MNNEIRAAKAAVVKEIKANIDNSVSTVIAENVGLTVTELNDLRNELKENNIKFKVYKNTLSKLAVKDGQFKDFSNFLNGPTVTAFNNGDDETAAIRIIDKFAQEHKNLKIKAASLEGRLLTSQEISEIAAIPGREGLLTMLASALISPLRDITVALHLYNEQKQDA